MALPIEKIQEELNRRIQQAEIFLQEMEVDLPIMSKEYLITLLNFYRSKAKSAPTNEIEPDIFPETLTLDQLKKYNEGIEDLKKKIMEDKNKVPGAAEDI